MRPDPDIVQPDIEAWVLDNLRALAGVSAFMIMQTRAWPGWVVAASIQVDARAARKKHARDLAEQARLIMARLPGTYWPEGVVSHVIVTEGPFWQPDEVDGTPCYHARYELRVHPRRGAARAPLPGAGHRHAAASQEGTTP